MPHGPGGASARRTRAVGFWGSLVSGFLLLAAPAWTLDPSKSITQYGHDLWRDRDGLPQNSVSTILQTRDGYLWFGTLEGLVRFDGISFTVFDKANTGVLASNNISVLAEGADGALWVGSERGLTRLKDGHFTGFTSHEGLGSNVVTSLMVDRSGTLWIGGLDSLTRYAGSFSTVALPTSTSSAFVTALLEDRAGTIWIGTSQGLLRYSEGAFVRYTVDDGLNSNVVNALLEDRRGDLWVGTDRAGLCRFEQGRFVAHPIPGTKAETRVKAVLEDKDGSLWLGTWGAGVARYRDGRFAIFDHSSGGLSVDFVFCLYEDREGSLWIGSNGGGLDRLRESRFTTYTTREGLSEDVVSSVFEDRQGAIWVGTQGGGLNRLKDGRFKTYTTKDGLAADNVVSILEDHKGGLWIGTVGGGLSYFKDDVFRTYSVKDGLSNPFVLCIFEDSRGTLWVGTLLGLSRFDDGRFITYGVKDGLPRPTVMSAFEDRAGGIWFGTNGGGAVRFTDGRFTPWSVAGPPGDINVVRAIHEDADGVLWFATNGGGLVRIQDGRSTNYTRREGLPDNGIHHIFEDDHGNFWMSSNKGIFRVRKSELTEIAAGSRVRMTAAVYGTADGMKSRECNGGSQPAAIKAKDGRLWFSTMGGVVMVDPNHIEDDTRKPPVAIGSATIDSVEFRMGGVEARPGAGELEFRYAGLSFLAPERVRFKYRLVGFDRGWVDAGTRRTAYYTNIPPGSYTFHVIACNKDGVWNEEGATFAFRLLPHVYQTAWFLASVAVLCVGAILGLVRLRTSRLRLRAKELQRGIDDALAKINVLTGLIPICAWCKKIRDDKGYWQQIETYVHEHSHADFSHGICPDCREKVQAEVATRAKSRHA